MSTFQPRRRAPRSQLRDVAGEEIRRLIVSGEAVPGTPLRLEALAEHVGVSMTPVREALLVLSQEGWVSQEPHRGFRVSSFRRRDIADLYVIQVFLFGELARRAAEHITEPQLAEIERIDAEIRATPDMDPRRLEELNYELHGAINAAADAPRLAWFAQASRFLPGGSGWTSIPGWLENARQGHEPLLRALRAGDGDRAAAESRAQTELAGRLLMDHLEKSGHFATESPAATESLPPAADAAPAPVLD